MRSRAARESEESLPLVAVVSKVPLLSEALERALDGIAEIRPFPAGRGETEGLLRWLEPDAVVVDSDEEAEAAAPYARTSGAPLVHISFRDRTVRVLEDGGWGELGNGDTTPEAIRNVIVGGIFAARHRPAGIKR